MKPMETFIKAITKPNDQAYREIANDPGASIGKAVLWLGISGLVGGFFTGLFQWIFGSSTFSMVSEYADVDIPEVAGGIGGVFSGAFGGLFGAIIGGFIFVGLVHLVSRMLNGTGSFEKLFYTVAAFQAPLGLITGVLVGIPFLGACISVLVGIYTIVLAVIANKAVHEYDTGKAVIATLAPAVVIFLFCCCVIAVFGTIFGAAFGDMFGNIMSNF